MTNPLPGGASVAGRCLGFDTVAAVTQQRAADMVKLKYGFAVRYLSRFPYVSTHTDGGSITVEEAEWILGAGLALSFVQFAKKHMLPTEGRGHEMGSAAAHNLVKLGVPTGVTAWVDVESVHPEATEAEVVGFVNAWSKELVNAGFEAGIYNGPGSKLTASTLYKSLRHTTRYWSSATATATVEKRGYCLVQGRSVKLGFRIDPNMARIDGVGDRFTWLQPPNWIDPHDPLGLVKK